MGKNKPTFPGSFKVNGSNLNIPVSFHLVTYEITFTENSLPPGTPWYVLLSGKRHNSTTNTIKFIEPNGSYAYAIETPISDGSGTRYVASQSIGTVTVIGAETDVNVSYTAQYYLSVIAIPSYGGAVSPSSGWYDAGSNITIDATPNGNFEFFLWFGTGNGSYSGFNNPSSITINGPVKEWAFFRELYKITFLERGLPPGTSWIVISNGHVYNTTNDSITLQLPNGSYEFTILTTNREYSVQGSALISLTVNGTDMEMSITFHLVTYAITFTESGLPSGTSWSVTLNGVTETSTNSTITFHEPYGTYSYSISLPSGYKTSSSSGTIKTSQPSLIIPITVSSTSPPSSPTGYLIYIIIAIVVIVAVIGAVLAMRRGKK